jgi:glycosyltransferase involved in cell wall biosynthesis
MISRSSITIMICTYNNCAGLQKTLDALGKCLVPPGWTIEALVVDNASTDDTEYVVRIAEPKNIEVRYLYEPKRGLSYARNTGLSQAHGDVILFTDDDVLVSDNWIIKLASPILLGQCDAATGQVSLAAHLQRPWMNSIHKGWLASSRDAQLSHGPVSLVGANMGFHRSVLDRVPGFDCELGAGALGSGEDTLFSLQLAEAGCKIDFNSDANAIHDFDSERLKRKRWLEDAVKRGRCEGYLLYHWEHGKIDNPLRERLSWWARLKLRRIVQPPPPLNEEGCSLWEMSYIASMEKIRQYCIESRRPRRYEYRGLRRIEFGCELRESRIRVNS